MAAKRFNCQLFVSRLSSYTTNEHLKNLFSPFGVVTEARLVKDQNTQRPKGFGFVTFQTEDEAGKALKAMDGRVLLSSCINHQLLSDFGKDTFKKDRLFLSGLDVIQDSISSGDEILFTMQIIDGRLIFVEFAKTARPGEESTASRVLS